MFSARYTTYMIRPLQSPATRTVSFALEIGLALTHERDESGLAGPEVLGPIITQGLNQHAGGSRQFGQTRVTIRWIPRWTSDHFYSGRALGIAVINDELYDSLENPAHPSAAQILMMLGGDPGQRRFQLILLRSSAFSSQPARQRALAAERRLSQVTHEIGHAVGLPDQRADQSSTMYYRQLTNAQYRRMDQRWSDTELAAALRGIFDAPGRTPPDWLA